MSLKTILLRYFLPMTVCFFGLSVLNLSPSIQKIYYPAFEKFTLNTLIPSQPDIYFKTKEGKPDNYNQIPVLYNTRKRLQAIIDHSRATGQQGEYTYKGFELPIDEYFVTPLIFFFSLLMFTPGDWKRKGINLFIGIFLIMGFAYCTVYFKGLHMVAESGVLGAVDGRTLKAYKLLSFAFSSVSTITIVLLVWVVLAFRKSDFRKFFSLE